MIPINRPGLGEEERREVLKVLEEGVLTSAASHGGRRVRDFERALADYLRSKHVIAVNSGTAALHAALMALDIGPGDEVILPAFTFVATANAVAAAGAKPVFVDIKRERHTIDVKEVKQKINRRTKAIIPVHLYGHPCDIEVIELAEKRSLAMVEDACQSLGSTIGGRQTGTLGQMGCFSLYASKVLTAGEGGAIATDDSRLADRLKMIRNHGMVKGYDTRVLGLNLRLPEVSAAIAKVQMSKLDSMLKIRRRNAEYLSQALSTVKGISLPAESNDMRFNWYLYTIAFASKKTRYNAKMALEKARIGAAVYYDPPVHKTPYYRKIAPITKLPVTEWCSKRVLSLPVHPSVTLADVDRMANTLEAI